MERVITLSMWKNQFEKAKAGLPEHPERMKELFNEFSTYFEEHNKFMTLGEYTAFRSMGYEIQKIAMRLK